MTSLFMKIIICPLVVALSAYILPNVNYTAWIQPIIIGLSLAVVGTLMEYIFLKRGTLWTSTFLDFIAATLIVYGVSYMMEGTAVTFFGALIVAVFLAVIEHFTHLYLIRTNKTVKSHA
ncbi:hypothetical protein ACFSCX_03190 [Bacillus salitolerans]|uniref:DUF2512 family protein n=1 Tax=Bacillus salitolerans TaxID=1437434 RepID=A0ABW4LK91_9BACI